MPKKEELDRAAGRTNAPRLALVLLRVGEKPRVLPLVLPW